MKIPRLPCMPLRIKFPLIMSTIVALCIISLFFWMFKQSREAIYAQVDSQARSLLLQVSITRAWVADHGGLFVMKKTGVEANPFLPGTKIQDQNQKIYYFRNPALVTRELSEYAEKAGLYKFRLTSLKLKNPANAPLPFEQEALLFFQKHGYESTKDGIASTGVEDGVKIYRRIIPLRVDVVCLQCHDEQGYQEGEIRGGLSVIIPMQEAEQAIKANGILLITVGLAIVLIVLAGIYFLTKKMLLDPVTHLHNGAKRLKGGEYTVRARLSSGDELEDLAQTFNKMNDRLQKGYQGTLKSLIAAIDARDNYTKGHTARVSNYALEIAREMGLGEEQLAELEMSAVLHDIGKIGVSDHVLRKPGPLTGDELLEMQTHVQKGVEIIKGADFLLDTIPAVSGHHEHFDGTGYPNGLAGDDLPLLARILAVADAFDAMTYDRPYRRASSGKEAIDEIIQRAGRQFDPLVVQAFVKTYNS